MSVCLSVLWNDRTSERANEIEIEIEIELELPSLFTLNWFILLLWLLLIELMELIVFTTPADDGLSQFFPIDDEVE